MHTASSDVYTLSLHDALPILGRGRLRGIDVRRRDTAHDHGLAEHLTDHAPHELGRERTVLEDRKSTRLNSSHRCISYAVFCLKKKTITTNTSNLNILINELYK